MIYIGNIATSEGLSYIMRDARERFVRSEALETTWSIPDSAGTFAMPVEIPEEQRLSMEAENELIRNVASTANQATLDMMREMRPGADLLKSVFKVSDFPVDVLSLASAPQAWEDVRFQNEAPMVISNTTLDFVAEKDGVLGGFVFWCFVSCLHDAKEIEATQPGSHWDPLVLLLPPTPVKKGQTIRLDALADYTELQPRYTFRASIGAD